MSEETEDINGKTVVDIHIDIVVDGKPISQVLQIACYYCKKHEPPPPQEAPPPSKYSVEDIMSRLEESQEQFVEPEPEPEPPATWRCTHKKMKTNQLYSEACTNIDWHGCPFNPENTPKQKLVERATALVQDDAQRTEGREVEDGSENLPSVHLKPKRSKRKKKEKNNVL